MLPATILRYLIIEFEFYSVPQNWNLFYVASGLRKPHSFSKNSRYQNVICGYFKHRSPYLFLSRSKWDLNVLRVKQNHNFIEGHHTSPWNSSNMLADHLQCADRHEFNQHWAQIESKEDCVSMYAAAVDIYMEMFYMPMPMASIILGARCACFHLKLNPSKSERRASYKNQCTYIYAFLTKKCLCGWYGKIASICIVQCTLLVSRITILWSLDMCIGSNQNISIHV